MHIYQAVEFVSAIDKGGSTCPWVVKVFTDSNTIVPYVVKLFTPSSTAQYQPIAKEVFGNRLAIEFDLPVPEYALIELSAEFIDTLPEQYKDRLHGVSPGLKFGSAEAKNMSIVKPELLPSFLKEYNLGTIFAFDNLVQNLDRGGFRNKPNLLINDENVLLIDHEQIFYFANDAEEGDLVTLSLDPNGWSSTYAACYKHVFFPHLKAYRRETRNEAFDTFHEHLRFLDVSCLDIVAKELQENGISVGNFPRIKKYLSLIKANHNEFIQLLKSLFP